MNTSPRTSSTAGASPRRRSGIAFTVRRLAVTSSPVLPSPRVAPRTNAPCSKRRLMASPSSFGSTENTGSASPVSRAMRATKSCTSSSSNALASDSIGTACATSANAEAGVAPTRWVGEFASKHSGCAASSASSSRTMRSYSMSGISGSSSTW